MTKKNKSAIIGKRISKKIGSDKMMTLNKSRVYVIGHKNPDTDSICSAVAYAKLKTELTGIPHIAKRAGKINEETQYVIKRFEVTPPKLLSTVQTQVKDLDINRMEGINPKTSIKKAWELMKKERVQTLPITLEGQLEGLITIGDIAKSYMEVYDSQLLGKAKTQFRNIANTVGGEIVTGNEHGYFLDGKVVVAASSPDTMEKVIEQNDLVILGNRYETQLCAMELDASCLVICQGAEVSRTIKKMAEERSVTVITTPYDTFTVSRLINQSIPVKYFMCKENLVTFHVNEFVDDIKETMAKKRHRDFPVLDAKGSYVGLISRRRLLEVRKKNLILVDHNEKSQAVNGIEDANILEIIDHHRIGSLETIGPVFFRNQPVGCTATIVYQMYREAEIKVDETTAGLLCAAIVSDTLMFRSPTCTKMDQDAAQCLAKVAKIDIEEFANEMFHAGSNLKNKTPEEIIFQDFKKFEVSDVKFAVAQINFMNKSEMDEVKEKIQTHLETVRVKHELDMLYFMITNITEEYTELLCCGENAKEQIVEAFDLQEDVADVILKDVVSRKKQLIPTFVVSLQQ